MNTTLETLPCYGKINLFLEVQDRRNDGFHNLGTLFQTVSCCDQLSAEAWDSLELICPSGITTNPEENLILKAARLLLAESKDRLGEQPKSGSKSGAGATVEPTTGTASGGTAGAAADSGPGIRFHLEKNLPAGAGLGGGSSDAASALILCNRIWKLGYTLPELMPLAAQLGADVPFFLYGGTSFAEGKGEILSPAPEPHPFHIVIGTPDCRVETGWAYGQLDKREPGKKFEWARFKALYFTYCEDWQFYQVLRNDFDIPMRRHFIPIQTLFDAMQSFSPVKTLLSGSGASLFSLFREKSDAEACLRAIQPSCRFSCLSEFVS